MHVSRAGADTGAYINIMAKYTRPNTHESKCLVEEFSCRGVGGRLIRESYRVYDTYCSEYSRGFNPTELYAT